MSSVPRQCMAVPLMYVAVPLHIYDNIYDNACDHGLDIYIWQCR